MIIYFIIIYNYMPTKKEIAEARKHCRKNPPKKKTKTKGKKKKRQPHTAKEKKKISKGVKKFNECVKKHLAKKKKKPSAIDAVTAQMKREKAKIVGKKKKKRIVLKEKKPKPKKKKKGMSEAMMMANIAKTQAEFKKKKSKPKPKVKKKKAKPKPKKEKPPPKPAHKVFTTAALARNIRDFAAPTLEAKFKSLQKEVNKPDTLPPSGWDYLEPKIHKLIREFLKTDLWKKILVPRYKDKPQLGSSKETPIDIDTLVKKEVKAKDRPQYKKYSGFALRSIPYISKKWVKNNNISSYYFGGLFRTDLSDATGRATGENKQENTVLWKKLDLTARRKKQEDYNEKIDMKIPREQVAIAKKMKTPTLNKLIKEMRKKKKALEKEKKDNNFYARDKEATRREVFTAKDRLASAFNKAMEKKENRAKELIKKIEMPMKIINREIKFRKTGKYGRPIRRWGNTWGDII